MKLEDEIQVIFKGLECGELCYIDFRRKSNASKEIKSLIERYCKRQREICAEEWDGQRDNGLDYGEEKISILLAQLATEE